MSLIAVSAIFPIYYMVSGMFRTKGDWEHSQLGLPTTTSLQAFQDAWTSAHIGLYLRNSVIVTVGTLVLTVVFATMAGYAFSTLHWRGRAAAYFFTLSWMALPPLVLIVPIYIEMVDLHLLNTYWSVIFLYTAINLPFSVYLMSSYFRAIPEELVAAARLDGASVHRILFELLVPMARPALATLSVFTVLYVWNEFVFALLLLNSDGVKTLTVGVQQMQGRFFFNFPALMAGLLIASLPMIGVYLIFQKHLVKAVTAGAVK
jgi:ABC-type glycerol-3-phosphate transport system permease component